VKQKDRIPEKTDGRFDVLIIGAGPIGLACAIEAKKRGLRAVVIEKGCLANSIYHYPTTMRFSSTPDLLEIGGVPFITSDEKPTRMEALSYYRRIARSFDLDVRLYEAVFDVEGEDGDFTVRTEKDTYRATKVIAAIGFFDKPRMLKVPGEELDKVRHYYKEAHIYADQDLLVVGNGNSAAEAALECFRHDARVTMSVRSEVFHEGIKYWVLPDIENRIKAGDITVHFNTRVTEIRPKEVVLSPKEVVLSPKEGDAFTIPNDFVLALTGYEPDFDFLRRIGVEIREDRYRSPAHDEKVYESNRPGLYLAGVVVGGMCTNKWFIENSRDHARAIFEHMDSSPVPGG
jgi:thioredoxin reductase (NADPH)